jgi:hypothetical protein
MKDKVYKKKKSGAFVVVVKVKVIWKHHIRFKSMVKTKLLII